MDRELQSNPVTGAPGAYNIAGDGLVTVADIAREIGLLAIPLPGGAVRRLARAVVAAPVPTPPQLDWIEAIVQPAVMDTAKAKRDLGWSPRYTSLEALRDLLGRFRH